VALMIDRRDRAVLEVARDLLSDLDVEVVLERLLEAARELTSAQYAAIGILNEAGSGLARFVTLGIDEETRRAIGTLPTGRGLLGELIAHPRPLRVADLGLHPRSYGFPLGHPPMRTFLGVPVSGDGEPFGNIYVTEKLDGDEFTAADEEALVVLAAFAGLAVDHARRYTGAETQRHDLERTVAALDASIQISRALGAETSLDAILELVAKRGRALVGARALLIEQLDGDQLVISVGAGEVPDGVIGERTPVSGTVASIALATGESQHLNDDLNRARFDEHGLGRLGMPAAVGLVVPLVHGGAGYGVLVALDRTDGGAPFTREEQRLLESFASSAAAAVASARSASREQHRQRVAAAEAERTRWARELHDETLQGLASLRLMLGAVQRAEGEEPRRQAIDQSITHIEQEIATLRSLITELRPAALDELGSEAAVRALADRTAAQGLAVDLDIRLAHEQRGAQRHVAELETAIYRIVQEALTNARKHGGAQRAAVEIIDLDRSVRITVRDNGSGFDPASKTDGYGILGMRERAQLLGGTLDIASTPGEETTLTAVLPLHRRREPEEPVADQGRRSG
jgi:signal transduction histidine kinase